MRAALVFGAGATLANARHFHRERLTDRNPPLDRTFFKVIKGLDISVPTDLRRYAADLPTGSPFDTTEKSSTANGSGGTVKVD